MFDKLFLIALIILLSALSVILQNVGFDTVSTCFGIGGLVVAVHLGVILQKEENRRNGTRI